jgi:hypothetical protein
MDEIEVARTGFDSLKERASKRLPLLTEKQITHLCNKASNIIRRAKHDVYVVEFMDSPPEYGYACNYYVDYVVDVSGKDVHVVITVD